MREEGQVTISSSQVQLSRKSCYRFRNVSDAGDMITEVMGIAELDAQ